MDRSPRPDLNERLFARAFAIWNGRAQTVPYDDRFMRRSRDWLRDPEIQAMTGTQTFTEADQAEWFAGLEGRSDYFIWGVELDGLPVGAYGLKHCDGASAEYWLYIGEKEHWSRGLGAWMVCEAVSRAREMGLRTLWARILRENTRSLKLAEASAWSEYEGEEETHRFFKLELD